MFAPLRTFMAVLWVSSIAGAAVVLCLAMGWVSWTAFALSGVLGVIVGVPAGIWTAQAIKKQDPNWPRRRYGLKRKRDLY